MKFCSLTISWMKMKFLSSVTNSLTRALCPGEGVGYRNFCHKLWPVTIYDDPKNYSIMLLNCNFQLLINSSSKLHISTKAFSRAFNCNRLKQKLSFIILHKIQLFTNEPDLSQTVARGRPVWPLQVRPLMWSTLDTSFWLQCQKLRCHDCSA